jgi:two-component system, LytTR family, response regulator
MRVLLVDDEPLALRRLQMAFSDIEGVEVVGTASDGDAAAQSIVDLRPDLVMLDVQMPGRSGMAVAAGLPQDHRPEIVFLTAFEHYAADAFDVEAADYLLKPVRLDRLRQAVSRARRRRIERDALSRLESLGAPAETPAAAPPAGTTFDAELVVPSSRGPRRIPVEAITWIEASKDYALIHTSNRSFILRTTMSELEARLNPAQMLRVHRSAFVRLGAVRRVKRPGKGAITLVLDDDIEVQVGPNYVRSVRQALEASATLDDL